MYSVTPKKQSKLTAAAVGACFACGIGLFAVSIGQESLPFVTIAAQLISVLILTAGIYLYSKYIARQYTYTVQPGGIFDANGEEIYDLEVIETVGGRKQRVVCRLALRDIVQVDARPMRATKKNGYPKIEATQDGGEVFIYCADMVPGKVLAVYDADGNVVVLTYDRTLCEILKQKQ
ncbi:MAG: hypothetical protein IJW70_03145 [Clostridia bacterium]|nr:hypothetical protein [Clostridia bacterium]